MKNQLHTDFFLKTYTVAKLSLSTAAQQFVHSSFPNKNPRQPATSFLESENQTCRAQNPNIPRAGRGRAACSGVAGRGRARQFGTPTNLFAKERTIHPALQGIGDECLERLLVGTNKGHFM